jgi:putative membrane protein insertion efficiency factor
MRLIDYGFESHDVAAAAAAGVKAAKEAEKNGGSPAQKLSLPRRLGKGLIKNYKQYVSPYLMTACKHTPSCSQYGREAIEKHGLIQGSKMAFMRILSCNDRAEGRYDPVPDVPGPGEPLICKGDHGPAPASMLESNLPQAVLTPPRPVEKSRMRRAVERCLISAGELTGKALGGALCALAALPLGAAMGTIIGARAGTDRIDDMNRSLSKTYSIDSVRQFLKIEHALGDPAYKTFRFVRDLTSSETAAKIVGGAVGVTTGFLLGAAGGAVTGLRWGKRFAGLFGENFVKDMLGELPKNPAAETVLRNFYGK